MIVKIIRHLSCRFIVDTKLLYIKKWRSTCELLLNHVITDNYICNKEWKKVLDAFHEDTWHRR